MCLRGIAKEPNAVDVSVFGVVHYDSLAVAKKAKGYCDFNVMMKYELLQCFKKVVKGGRVAPATNLCDGNKKNRMMRRQKLPEADDE